MKKITFDDRFGLTQAVLDGRKTMVRKIIKAPKKMDGIDCYGFCVVKRPGSDEVVEVLATDADGGEINIIVPPYNVGEIIAVSQCLHDMGYDPRDTRHNSGAIWGLDHTPAWINKMFVCASDCIHRIRITNVRVERLQDISDEDCLREGIEKDGDVYSFNDYEGYKTPQLAFKALINRISGKGTWEMNPWVFAYEFELVK